MEWIDERMKAGGRENNNSDIDVLMKKAADGNKDACFNLAIRYANGDGVEKDISKALELYEPYVKDANLAAMHNSALLYCNYYGDNPDMLHRGVQLFHEASDKGFLPSDCELMKLYLIGFGVRKNYMRAIEYLMRSIEGGNEKCANEYYQLVILMNEYGNSLEEPIFILEEVGGVQVEYELLSHLLGQKNRDWSLKKQTLLDENGAQVDKLDIELVSGEDVTYYFDISRTFSNYSD